MKKFDCIFWVGHLYYKKRLIKTKRNEQTLYMVESNIKVFEQDGNGPSRHSEMSSISRIVPKNLTIPNAVCGNGQFSFSKIYIEKSHDTKKTQIWDPLVFPLPFQAQENKGTKVKTLCHQTISLRKSHTN